MARQVQTNERRSFLVTKTTDKMLLRLHLANPRGFCAGVERAVLIVEQALAQYGAPVYVRHEIVHNRRVVERLEKLGAIFVDEIDEIPDGAPMNVPVIFSAHGVPKSVPQAASARGLNWLDATCPLVSKVHIEVARHVAEGRHILLIGHAAHPEIIGTMGQVPAEHVSLIENADDARNVAPPPVPLAYASQTTLSVDDTAEIIAILTQRFADIAAPHKDDICYATTNRQQAVKKLATKVSVMLVIGASNSSNAQRLVEVATRAGCAAAYLIKDVSDINWEKLIGVQDVGLTAGASAPEEIVQEVISAFEQHFNLHLINQTGLEEAVHFKLPRALRQASQS